MGTVKTRLYIEEMVYSPQVMRLNTCFNGAANDVLQYCTVKTSISMVKISQHGVEQLWLWCYHHCGVIIITVFTTRVHNLTCAERPSAFKQCTFQEFCILLSQSYTLWICSWQSKQEEYDHASSTSYVTDRQTDRQTWQQLFVTLCRKRYCCERVMRGGGRVTLRRVILAAWRSLLRVSVCKTNRIRSLAFNATPSWTCSHAYIISCHFMPYSLGCGASCVTDQTSWTCSHAYFISVHVIPCSLRCGTICDWSNILDLQPCIHPTPALSCRSIRVQWQRSATTVKQQRPLYICLLVSAVSCTPFVAKPAWNSQWQPPTNQSINQRFYSRWGPACPFD